VEGSQTDKEKASGRKTESQPITAKHTTTTAHSTELSPGLEGSNGERFPKKDPTQNLGIFGNNIPSKEFFA
jgi:hypothetical protein